MTAALVAALGLVALGLMLVRTAAPLARLCAWAVALLFAAFAAWLPWRLDRERTAPVASTALGGEPANWRTSLLAAAAHSGAAANAVQLVWQEPLASPPTGSFGADLRARPVLPFAPDELQVELAGPAWRDRPLRLQVRAPRLATPLAGDLRILQNGRLVHQAAIEVGGTVVDSTFVPPAAGACEVELRVTAAPHLLLGKGGFVVTEARPVLVLEPSGLAAAALEAQGLAVTRLTALPADFGNAAAVVLGMPLPREAQERLAAAVADGLGLFALAPAFAAAGEPLHALLPLRPAPQSPDPAGEGERTASGGEPAETPPAPPAEPPPTREKPPRGGNDGASRVSDQPIEVDKRAIAMVLVIDRSGSMGTTLADGKTKMSYAKTSALRTAQALTEGDRVGIVTFGNKDQGRIVLPLTPATDSVAVRAGIEELAHANEFTYLLGGLRRAYDLLGGVDAAVKHVVVISDGEFDKNEEVALRALAHRMRSQRKVTLSLIALTDEHTASSFKLMAGRLSKEGGGEFFEVMDARSVPAFVSAEVTRSLERVGRKPRDGTGIGEPSPAAPPTPTPPPTPEPTPTPPVAEPAAPVRVPVRAVADSPLLAPLPTADWPTLGRAVAGTAPLDARVLLVAGDDGWPLLAFANRGLGRVGAFAADLCGDDGAEFRAEAAFPARLATWVATVQPLAAASALAPLLASVVATPPAPTPREAAALAAFAGRAPLPAAAPAVPVVAFERIEQSRAAVAAPWLVVGLVLLVALERALAVRSLRGAVTPSREAAAP